MRSEIEDRIESLDVSDEAAFDRGTKAVAAALLERPSKRGIKLRQFAVAGVLAVVFFTASAPGRDVAAAAGSAAGDLVGISDSTQEEQQAQLQPYLDRTDAFDALLQRLIIKADAGELNADVDQAAAAQTMREALDPPADPAAAKDLQTRMIELTEQLRAAGDMPPIGAPTETFYSYGN